MTVFVVEDDDIISEGLKISLEQEGYRVLTASTQADAMELLRKKEEFHVCLLDVMLPDGNGYEICKEIRKESDVPVLFLTACDDEVHTVLALEQGADDYIAKPFRIRELLARMKAVLRRYGKGEASGEGVKPVTVGSNRVELASGKVYREGEEIILTAMEYKLLLIFIRNRGQILTRQQILNNIWDEGGEFVNDNTLCVYVKRLRKKLDDREENALIRTIRGLGYRMEKE